MARLKLEHKFGHGIRKKMNEIMGVYQENEARKVKKINSKITTNEQSEEE